jgi:hypothetical protein
MSVRAVFIELPAFERHRSTYLDDEGFSKLQAQQRNQLKALIKTELERRRQP